MQKEISMQIVYIAFEMLIRLWYILYSDRSINLIKYMSIDMRRNDVDMVLARMKETINITKIR